MVTNTLYVVAGAVIISVLSVVKAEVDCNNHPAFADPKECCPMPNLISEELVEKCRGNAPPPPPPEGMNNEVDDTEQGGPPRHHHRHGPHGHHGRHGHHHCFPTCLFNETGILIDGQLNEENLDTFLSSATADSPDALPVLKESFQTCYQKSVEVMEKIREHFANKGGDASRRPPHPHHHRHCSPQAGIMFHCTMMETFKQCPDSIWTGTEECNNLREFITECMPSPADDEEQFEEVEEAEE
ncbi:uncharacterized protein [Musca autumnalis]|uniref:uncharacterized protein n=1 Tax=Musca autumnalis TaxID=221902 RepID=UPI003CF9888B